MLGIKARLRVTLAGDLENIEWFADTFELFNTQVEIVECPSRQLMYAVADDDCSGLGNGLETCRQVDGFTGRALAGVGNHHHTRCDADSHPKEPHFGKLEVR